MKIGLFGGTFDPVHKGHIALARAAVRECGLDRIYFIPALRSPFKSARPLSDSKHRLAMVRMAVRGTSKAKVSRFEIDGPRISYTVRTVKEFRQKFPRSSLYLLLGSDSLRHFRRWKNWRKILNECALVTGKRHGHKTSLQPNFKDKLIQLKSRIPNVSSTKVREQAGQGRSLSKICPATVSRYIRKHELYAGHD